MSAPLRVTDRTRGTVLAGRCGVADNVVTRGIGLLGRAGLAEGEGLRITRTNAITMLFMRFAIDVVFVDRERRVVRIVERLRPWIPAVIAPKADEVLELPVGAVRRAGVQVGDVLEYGPVT